jgi:hypothetical protein
MTSESHPTLEPPAEQKITVTPALGPTERQVADTWNRIGGTLQTWVDRLAIDPGLVIAVWVVESGGQAFGPAPDRRMTIRFENHIFFDEWGKYQPEAFAQHFTFNSGPKQHWQDHRWRLAPDQPWRDVHENQTSEWEAFDFACTLDDSAARRSISMGGPQIMGFNYRALGCASVQDMFNDFAASEGSQVEGFYNFLCSQGDFPKLQGSPPDFITFAALYNPSNPKYEQRIREVYQIYRRLRTRTRRRAR